MMEARKLFLLDIDYVTIDEKAVVRLMGKEKLENGEKSIIALDSSFKPYIYATFFDLDRATEQLHELNCKEIEVVEIKDLGNPIEVLKIYFKNPQEVPDKRDEIRGLDDIKDVYEHDIPFYRRYLIDNHICPMSEIEITGKIIKENTAVPTPQDYVELIELDKPPKQLDTEIPELKIMSFDLEVRNPDGMPDSDKDEIIMIGVAGNMMSDRVLSTKGEHIDYAETFENETQVIERFVELIKEEQPDVIVGYNSDNFDFPYLNKRAEKCGVLLDLGMDGSVLKFIRRGFTNAGAIKGILHADLYLIMRRYIHLDRYTLERVYEELFGEEKIDVPGDKIWEYWDSDNELLDELFSYSLDDVVATYKIADNVLPLTLGLTQLVGQPFFDIARMTTGQQVEWYLIRQAYEYHELVPNKPTAYEYSSRKGKKNTGGYVKEPDKGLHENLVQFDFRSLYPSIIISKNVCPDSLIGKGIKNTEDIKDSDCHIAPEHGYKYLKTPQGFIPSVLGNILTERIKIKQAMKKAQDPLKKKRLDVQQQSIKRLANTMYGSYGYSRFRWYTNECAESITAWGREYIKDTIKKAEKYGFTTIYADTDGFYAKYEKK